MKTVFIIIVAGLLLVSGCIDSLRACTSFCMMPPGGPVFAANFDFFIPVDGTVMINRRGMMKKNIQPNRAGETATWVSRFGSVTFNIAGRGFAWSGMNEAGLVMSGMELVASEYPEPDDRHPFDVGTWTQYILDTCGSVEEAIRSASRMRLVKDGSNPIHFMFADESGNSAALEFLDGEAVVYAGESLPVRAMSNMPYGRALEALEMGGPRWWWSNPGYSAERFAAAASRMNSFNPDGEEPAWVHAMSTLIHVVAAPHTKWNVVYDIRKQEVWFRSYLSRSIKHISLKAFDLSCGAPLMMLKMNEPLAGNVEKAFKPYDRDVNLDIFVTYAGHAGFELSMDDATGIMDLYDSFKCSN